MGRSEPALRVAHASHRSDAGARAVPDTRCLSSQDTEMKIARDMVTQSPETLAEQTSPSDPASCRITIFFRSENFASRRKPPRSPYSGITISFITIISYCLYAYYASRIVRAIAALAIRWPARYNN